jgi:RNA polymerase sigma factor for flagellar operon FliA
MIPETLQETETTTFKPERCCSPAELWKTYAAAGPGSAPENALIQQYLPLVKTIVGRQAMTMPAHVDSEDLHSAGLVGLLSALRRFDAASGASFETYARTRIRGAILDELRRMNWVPRSILDKARRVEEVLRRLEQEKGRLPTDLEMARALGLSLDDYERLLEQIRPATFVCLDSLFNNEGEEGSRYEVLADESQPDPREGVENRELTQLIARRIEQLPDMQKKVLALYYHEGLRLREIAEVFGVTESRICQIHSQAILAVRSELRRQEIEPI